MNHPIYYKTTEVGRILGWRSETVRRTSFDMLPYVLTPGGHRRYLAADVERYKKLGYQMHQNRLKARRQAKEDASAEKAQPQAKWSVGSVREATWRMH